MKIEVQGSIPGGSHMLFLSQFSVKLTLGVGLFFKSFTILSPSEQSCQDESAALRVHWRGKNCYEIRTHAAALEALCLSLCPKLWEPNVASSCLL